MKNWFQKHKEWFSKYGWAVAHTIVLLIIIGTLARVSYAHSDEVKAAARLADIRSCERTNKIITDYNKQYSLIFNALFKVAREHPEDPVAKEVVLAFQSKGFPIVSPIDCTKNWTKW